MVESVHRVRRMLQLLCQLSQPGRQIIFRCCPRKSEPLAVESFHLAHDLNSQTQVGAVTTRGTPTARNLSEGDIMGDA